MINALEEIRLIRERDDMKAKELDPLFVQFLADIFGLMYLIIKERDEALEKLKTKLEVIS